MGTRTRVGCVAAAVAMLVLLAGCGNDDKSAVEAGDDGPERGGKLVVGLGDLGDGYNPTTSQLTPGALNVAKAIYDPIAAIDDQGVAQPYLVEAIEPNEDFTEWTITLRDGVTFHNGDPLTPQILATHLKSMQLGAQTFFVFEPVDAVGVVDEAARPKHEAGEISDEDYDVMRRQVLVYMNEPWSTFPAFLAGFQVGYVAHPDFVDGRVEDPVGTGPFVFDEWVPGDHLTVRRNGSYWREGLPYLNEVEFRAIVDSGARLQSLEAGDIDLLTTNSPPQVADLTTEASDRFQLVPSQGGGDEQVVLLNTQSGPTADVDVRRALQLATDRQALDDQLYDGFFELADAPFPEDSPWYTDPDWPDPDPEAAREIVDDWEARNGPLVITLNAVANQDDLEVAQVLAAQWEEAGIDTEIDTIEVGAVAERLPFGTFEAILIQFFPGADPDEHYPFWNPNPDSIGGPGELSINFTRYTSPVVAEALDGARRTADPDERAGLYAAVWEDWAQNVPYLWLYHNNYVLVAATDVGGLDAFTLPDGVPAPIHVWGSVFLTQVWQRA